MQIRQAITTKYLCPTNFKGARIKAEAEAGSITIVWDHSLNREENFIAAAKTLMGKLEWKGELVGGCMKSGHYCFVIAKG